MEAARVHPEHSWPDAVVVRPDPAAGAAAAPPEGGAPSPESGPQTQAQACRQAGDEAAPVTSSLSERDRRVLEFERQWWRYAGAKEKAIRVEFGLSATRYYQVLNVLIDSREALMADPMLVRRLRRLRAQRRRARAGRPDACERTAMTGGDAGAGG